MLWGWVSVKSWRTSADSLVLNARADRVGSARSLLFARIRAPVVDAGLIRTAILVTATPDQTHPVYASLVVSALAVAQARYHTHLLQTPFAGQAVLVVPAHRLALSVEANLVPTIGVHDTAGRESHTAALWALRPRQEFSGTRADRTPVLYRADGVGSATRLVARIHAFSRLAD